MAYRDYTVMMDSPAGQRYRYLFDSVEEANAGILENELLLNYRLVSGPTATVHYTEEEAD